MRKAVLILALTGLLGASATAQTAAELLQKAIYTQETLGDLNGAIQIYRQILGEAKDARALTAQAQFRLGACLVRTGHTAEGQKILEQFIKDYPEQKELVAQARELAPGYLALVPAPWPDGELLQLTFRLPAGLEIGTLHLTAESGSVDGRRTWQIGFRRFIPGQGGLSRITVDADTFEPISSTFRHATLGDMDTRYAANSASTTMQNQPEPKRWEYQGAVYDNDSVIHLIRRLPLADGYKIELPILAPFGAGYLKLETEVTGRENVETPAGTFDCYRVELTQLKQSFWISADAHRYLVKLDAGGVQAVLSYAGKVDTAAPASYQEPDGSFSVKTPAGWSFFAAKQDNGGATHTLYLLDPGDLALSIVSVRPGEAKKGDEDAVRKSIEENAPKVGAFLKDYQIRPASWIPRTVGNAKGWTVVGDYTDNGKKMVEVRTHLQTPTHQVMIIHRLQADQLPAMTQAFETIVNGFSGQ